MTSDKQRFLHKNEQHEKKITFVEHGQKYTNCGSQDNGELSYGAVCRQHRQLGTKVMRGRLRDTGTCLVT